MAELYGIEWAKIELMKIKFSLKGSHFVTL